MKRIKFRPHSLIAWAILILIASADGVESMTLAFFGIIALPIVILLCLLLPRRRDSQRWMLRNLIAVALFLAVFISVIWTSWPLRISYILAKPTMNKIAVKLEKGEKIKTPILIGVLIINKAELNRNGIPCLLTWSDGDFVGFVKVKPDIVDSQFNLWSVIYLDNDWQFINED